MDSKQILIDEITEEIGLLEVYKDKLENYPGQVISVRVTSINNLIKTGVSKGMSNKLKGRKNFFNGGAQGWITSEIERIDSQLSTRSAFLSSLQEG